MTKVVDSSTLRSHLADVLEEVSKRREYVLVTKRDQPVSALVNLDLFEDLLALTSLPFRKSIQEARKDYRKGRIFTHKDVFGDIG